MPPRAKTPVNESRNPVAEKMLTDKGFTWEYRIDIPIDQFDEAKSLHNQARVGKPLDDGTIERYMAALGNGDIFPAIIAAEPASARQKLLIVDGNHRFGAHRRAGKKTIDAYLIQGASAQAITMLTFEANTKHGLPTSEADRLHQALYLMDNGITAEEASRRLGLKPSTLRQAASLAATDRRAEEAGISRQRWDRLTQGVRLRLGQVTTDEGFAEMAKLTLDAQLPGPEVAKAVTQLNGLRSSRKQQDYVTALRATHKDALQTGGANRVREPIGRQQRSARTAFGMTLGQIGVLPAPSAIIERMTEDEKPEWIRRVDAAITVLQNVKDALKK